ncbi:WD40 repeat domain-containing protein [Streptomyces sp. NPDC059009]|uniref:WD40 repeat domain-containing protein n=1 Tax=Streptomyces sp. NPDC059009 TaxID=3346694 RepID=UPI0036954D1E
MSYGTRVLWAAGPRRDEVAELDGGAQAVGAVCALPLPGGVRLAGGTEDGRIRVWDPVSGAETLVLGGPGAAVFALCAVTVDGEVLLAAGGAEGAVGAVQVWNPLSGERSRTLTGHSGRLVNGLCAVPFGDHTLLASGGDDGTVRLWDPGSGRQVRVLGIGTEPFDGSHPVRGLCAFALEGATVLAAGGDDGTIRLWDAATGRLVHAFAGRPDTTRGKTCVLYAPGHAPVGIPGHTGPVYTLCALSLGGRTVLVSGGSDGKVRVWDPATGELVRAFDGGAGLTFGVCPVEAGGRTLLAAVGGGDYGLRLWDVGSGEPVRTLRGHTGPVWGGVCALPLPGRTLLASGGGKFDGMVRLWDPAAEPSPRSTDLRESLDTVCAVPLGGDRTLVATGSTNGAVRLWDAELGTRTDVVDRNEVDFTQRWVSGVCAVPVGGRRLLAAVSHNGTIRLHDPATGQDTRLIGYAHTDAVGTYAVTAEGELVSEEFTAVCPVPADGRHLLATCGERFGEHVANVRLWDPATGEHVRTVARHKGKLRTLCALPLPGDARPGSAPPDGTSPDGTSPGRALLAGAGWDPYVWLWDTGSDDRPRELLGHRGWVNALCAVPPGGDGRTLLASGSHDGTVRLWDPGTGAAEQVLGGHQDWVTGLCVLPLGGGRTLLASGSKDRTVRLWGRGERATGAEQDAHANAGADVGAETEAFRCLAVIPVRSPVSALAAADHRLFVTTSAGLLSLALDD